jgi:nicotinate-nucleotide adenylyltransferase
VAGLRLGILGGTFDPVHRGHLALARAALDEVALDRVLFLPAGQPWRKADRQITSADHRLAMLRLVLEGEGAFEIATLELEREGPSYAADTLEALQGDRPRDELFFILGEDALVDLPNWARPRRILELAVLVVARRAGVERKAVEEAGQQLPGLLDRVVWLKMPLVDVSGTEIRERVRRGLPVGGDLMLPAEEAYIRERGLYLA